jgi:hypothetical protein
LRALEAGMRVACARVEHAPFGVDTADDLERAREALRPSATTPGDIRPTDIMPGDISPGNTGSGATSLGSSRT